MSRLENTKKNAVWQVIGSLVTIGLTLANRYLFVWLLGDEYLGLNGLFGSVLGVLSFADLGISGCFTFCLYKPIAQQDVEYIQTLLTTLKKIMHIVMLLVLFAGIMLLPFLRMLVSGGDEINDVKLRCYYVLALVEVLAGYACTYKVCYVAACQQEYRLVPFRVASNVIATLAKFFALLITHKYIFYVGAGVFFVILQQIIISLYIDKKYPTVKKPTRVGPLKQADRVSIRRNVKAQIISKFAQVSVNQTDSLLISAGLDIGLLGRASNYTSLKGNVFGIISQIQLAATASMGNLMATEDEKKQLQVFYKYMMLSEWIIGLAFCGLVTLMTPLVSLLFGEQRVIESTAILLMCIATMFAYHTYALNILPSAGGRFEVGQYVNFVEGIVNLAVSIIAMRIWGLSGVFLGTAVAEVTVYILKPFSVFPKMYGLSPAQYFKRTLGAMCTMGGALGICLICRTAIMAQGVTWINFSILFLVVLCVFPALFTVVWIRDVYFRDTVKTLKEMIRSKIDK